VFASHSNEFLARLCKTAMWIDHGTIKMTGNIEDVVRAYEGDDAARHVREVLDEHRADWPATAMSASREEQTALPDD
jgi:ABC-2 type transport system ATP-binding protein